MDLTTALTGLLPVIVVISALLTALVSLWLLRRYRQAVLRAMGAGSDTGAGESILKADPVSRRALPVEAPQVPDSGSPGQRLYRVASSSLRRVGQIHALAGLAYALVLSAPWIIYAEDGLSVMRLLWLTAVYFWPAVLVILLVSVVTPRGRLLVLLGYALSLFLLGGIALVRYAELQPGQLAYHWLFANGAATLLAGACLLHRIRAVGPLVLAFMVAGVSGAMLLITLVGTSDSTLRASAAVGAALGLGAHSIFVGLHLLGFALFALLGWWLLGRLGGAYVNKRFSDQSLLADALVLLFAVMQSFTLAFEHWAWVFTGLVAFAAYRLVAQRGYRLCFKHRDDPDPPVLLVLRVFALGRRSERLFRALSLRWLRAGSMDLIAGPDLVTSTVEPHEFLDFLGGRLADQFIEDETELHKRLAGRDHCPDPDGRFRVNEFFCRQSTWQAAMSGIAADSDAVLMDLRSFSPDNQGCLWELEQLLAHVPLERTLFLTDSESDRAFLGDNIQEIWQRLPAGAVNTSLDAPTLRLFSADGPESETARNLAANLFEAAARGRA